MPKKSDFPPVQELRVASPEEALQIKAAAGIPTIVAPPAALVAKAMAVAAKKTKPGKERWPVKTGADPDAGAVQHVIVPTTVEELARMKRPKGMLDPAKTPKSFQQRRGRPVETTIWRISCDIVALKLEDDGDYHVVVQGASGEFMIAEFPTPGPPFVKASSPFSDNIRTARLALEKKFKKPITALKLAAMAGTMMPVASFSAKPVAAHSLQAVKASAQPFKTKLKATKATITGVGFFDRKHDQTGVAQNGIELHPVLGVQF